MKPCWKHLGLTEEGAKIADTILGPMTVAVELAVDRRMAALVLCEALYRRFDLPTKADAYQKNYKKKNGMR